MRLLTSLAAAAGVAQAVIVTENSPCAVDCGNVGDGTSTTDLGCTEDSFHDDSGSTFTSCVECEMHSGYSEGNQSDTQWMLYNLRYGAAYCLFGYPKDDKVSTNPCITTEACEPYEEAIKYKKLDTDVGAYDYCDKWPVYDGKHFDQCQACLRTSGEDYLSNFITVLQAGCKQKPEGNVTVAFEGEVFSNDMVNVTAPTPEATIDPAWFDQGPLTVGAKAGIVAGGIAVLLMLAGCCVVWRGRRRRKAFLRNYDPSKAGMRRGKGWPSAIQVNGVNGMEQVGGTPLSQKPFADASGTPLSQRPLRAWDDSPMSTQSADQHFQRYFSPYSSQYTSPVSANEGQQQNWPVLGPQGQTLQQEQQQNMTKNIGLAFGGNGGGDDSSTDSKGKDKAEAYEMQNVEHGSEPNQQSYFTHSRSYSGSYRNFGGRRESGA